MKYTASLLVGVALLTLLVGGCATQQPATQAGASQVTAHDGSPTPAVAPLPTPTAVLPPATSPQPVPPTNAPVSANRSLPSAATAPVSSSEMETNTALQLAADYEKYQQGKISKGTMMQSVWNARNRTRQELYGVVVDQHGQPVAEAEVTGTTEQIRGFDVGEKFEHFKTKTDAEGKFQFTGLHGSRLGADISKEGYAMNYLGGVQKPAEQSTPANRVIYTMWKLKGAEPMIWVRDQEYKVPYDGRSAVLTLQRTSESGFGPRIPVGQLRVTLLREPLQVSRGGQKFNWTAKLEIPGGGLLPENDLYPNWAPASGYQAAYEASMKADAPNWDRRLTQNFYFKNEQGQYGRIWIDLFTDSDKETTGIGIAMWLNPSGSQNLEFDPNQEIR